jgi:hypothetical protein
MAPALKYGRDFSECPTPPRVRKRSISPDPDVYRSERKDFRRKLPAPDKTEFGKAAQAFDKILHSLPYDAQMQLLRRATMSMVPLSCRAKFVDSETKSR